jgi:preprotein translocase subunit Sec61beta
MAKNKINMPQGSAGLTRYFDDVKSKFEFHPGHIIVLCLIVIIIMAILHVFGDNWFLR